MVGDTNFGIGKRKLVELIIEKNFGYTTPDLQQYSYNQLLFVIQEMMHEEGKAYLEGQGTSHAGFSIFKAFIKHCLYRNIANYDTMLLVEGSKGCITKDTKIQTPEGIKSFKQMKLRHRDVLNVMSWDFRNKVWVAAEAMYFDTGKKIVYDIVMEDGKKVQATKDHKFFVVTERIKEVSVKNISVGDVLFCVNENCKIKSITTHNKKETCDLTVPIYHNFILENGIVTHNSGKSSAGIMMAKYWCKLLGIQFAPERHIAYTNADMSRKIDMLEKFEPLLCLAGDTIIDIQTSDGYCDRVPLNKLIFYRNFKVLSYNRYTKKFYYSKCERAVLTKINAEVYEIVFDYEKSYFKATKEHPILTKRGYITVENLLLSDEVITTYGFRFTKIKSIKKCKYLENVFNIINTASGNFVANNIVVHNCDEAVRFCSSEDWAKKENRELKKKLAQVRTKHLFFILCFPLKIYKVDKIYLESFTNYWISLYGRGKSIVFVRDENPVSDAWRLKDFLKIGNFNEFSMESKIRDTLKKHPNFWTTMGIPKPSRELYERYLKVREKNVYDDDNILSSMSKEDIVKSLLVLSLRDIMVRDTTLNMNRIMLHIKNEYDVPINKDMIQAVIEDSKQLIIKVREKALSINEV
jgi:hypothetical protein